MTSIETVQTFDPRVNINNKRVYAVQRTASEITYKEYNATSYSNNNFNFSCPPPSKTTIIDRKIYLRVPVNIKFNGTCPTGQRLLQNHNDAFRSFPLSSIINTLQLTINQNSQTMYLSEVISGLTRYYTPQQLRNYDYSFAPLAMDRSQNYSDMVGLNANPLAGYGENTYENSRGGFPYSVASNNVSLSSVANTTAEINAVLTEPLIISPLVYGSYNEPGLVGITSFDVVVNFDNDLTRIWSHSNSSGSVITSMTVSFGQPSLLHTYLSPTTLTIPPQINMFPFYRLDRYITTPGAAVAPLSSLEISSNSVQLNSIPKRIYVFARKQTSDRTFLDTDSFMSIESINLTFGNKSGLLAGATKQHLYRISKDNGCSLSWPEWSGEQTNDLSSGNSYGTVGSVLCLEMKDIGMDDLTSVGMLENVQFYIRVVVKNQNQLASINPALYVVIVSEGVWTIKGDNSTISVGVLNPENVLAARSSPVVDQVVIESLYGGNFMEGLKSIWSTIKSGIKEVGEALSPLAPLVSPLAKAVGLGNENQAGGRMVRRSELRHRQ